MFISIGEFVAVFTSYINISLMTFYIMRKKYEFISQIRIHVKETFISFECLKSLHLSIFHENIFSSAFKICAVHLKLYTLA